MIKEDSNQIATVNSAVKWAQNDIHHTDCFANQEINFYRDFHPENVHKALRGQSSGKAITLDVNVNELIPSQDFKGIVSIKNRQFNQNFRKDLSLNPRYGRFYPKGLLKDLAGIFKVNMTPFRLVDIQNGNLRVDLKHPMAKKNIQLKTEITEISEKSSERGGASTHWIDDLLNGIGMQSRYNGAPTDFFSDDPFKRSDDHPDDLFYKKPRMVSHLDETAISVLRNQYGKILKPDMNVLDFMSSWKSHLPTNIPFSKITGLGLNAEELSNNTQLNDYITHDINENPVLPFEDNQFDAIVCTVSVEYMIHPIQIFNEISRILKPKGLFIVSFSNRWFEPKAIQIWKEIQEFERVGLVIEYFLQSKKFERIETFSMRGLPRPVDDKYYNQYYFSDPVFCVWGKNKS